MTIWAIIGWGLRNRKFLGGCVAFILFMIPDIVLADCTGPAPLNPITKPHCLQMVPYCVCRPNGECGWVFVCRTIPEEIAT